MLFRCYYCEREDNVFSDIIRHLLEQHSQDKIKFKKLANQKLQSISYKVVPEICREQGRIITVNEREQKIHVSRANVRPKDSPFKKLMKIESNTQDQSANENGALPYEDEMCGSYINEENPEHEDSVYEELVALLPGVLDTLRKCDKIDEYLAFHRLLEDKKFQVTNIAFLLFLDVVRWLSLDKSTTFMRYSDEVKLFWQTGLRLFHGRFLRFMSGPKNQGQVIRSETSPGHFDPKEAKINFAVPDRRVLQDEEKIILDSKPGVFYSMIDIVSQADSEQRLTYKLCVDGKKINPCSSGEVDLWGFESEPTYENKQKRLNEERNFLAEMQKEMEKLIELSHMNFSDLTYESQVALAQKSREAISIISERIKDLRHLKLNKEIVLNKLQSKIEVNWKNSQYAMVISSIRTALIQIEICIDDFLKCNERLCQHAAQINNAVEYLRSSKEVNLQTQGNLVCLANSETDEDLQPHLVKQRSERWMHIRKTSVVTGSTIHKAIGLDTLKKQREHLEVASGKKEPTEISADLQAMFDHGTANEVNAVATFVSTVLPSFCPKGMFYEEGCYIEEKDGKSLLVVSPDGSIRHCDDPSTVLFGIEIKCPMPDKAYTTPVHYSIPRYYIPQILSEMNALKANRLFFLSYSKESMTVHLAEFDEDLWSDIVQEIQKLDVEHLPKRKQLSVENLKQRIHVYQKQNVKLIAEIKSKTAKICDHASDMSSGKRIFHPNDNEFNQNQYGENSLKEMLKTVIRCTEVINKCHRLCVQKASEVMVFLVSDLDRAYKAEKVHAYPIAYGLRGYSVKSESVRKLIQSVLSALFMRGIYTPAVAYDGEWASLAFKTDTGEPLTVLELQRKVYNNVKKRSKAEIVKTINETAVVKAATFEELLEQVDYSVDKRGSVTLGVKEGTKLFVVSTHMERLLKSNMTAQKSQDKCTVSETTSTGVDSIFSTISPEILGTLEHETIESINDINNESIAVSSNCLTTVLGSDTLADMLQSENIPISNALVIDRSLQDNDREPVLMDESHEQQSTEATQVMSDGQCNAEIETILSLEDVEVMLTSLKTNKTTANKWLNKTVDDFHEILRDPALLKFEMTKNELIFCLESVKTKLEVSNIRFGKSWNKQKLSDFLHRALNSKPNEISAKPRQKKKFNPNKLSVLCKRKLCGFTKASLNAVLAEHEFDEQYQLWTRESPFSSTTKISNVGEVTWFSAPEFNSETLSYIFSFLDVHHLITNCRIKVCKDGFPERHIRKQAWLAVAKENKTRLKLAHVEDLLDKQSDSIAKETFSKDVELAMLRLGYNAEANFCKLIREFYEAEDEPGLTAVERCGRRIRLRNWLLEGVNFGCFPPCGFYVRGIPHIMFQGLLTNIDRRIQIIPYVKSGAYNVRTLGSLEAENLFGEFQDLDPKGSGVIKAEDIPAALESACQLQKTRLMAERPFHMSLSKAKVYPNHELMDQGVPEDDNEFFYPTYIPEIGVRDHEFDAASRAKRSAKRRLVRISAPDEAARGVKPIRQIGGFSVNESKLLDSRRANLDII